MSEGLVRTEVAPRDEPGARADRPGSFWEEAAPGLGMRGEAGGRDEGFGDAGTGVGGHSAVCVRTCALACEHAWGGGLGGKARGGRRDPFLHRLPARRKVRPVARLTLCFCR